MKIEKSDYGYWVEYRDGRKRYFDKDSGVGRRIEKGLILDGLNKSRRALKNGTHETVVYFRDEEGKINIPPNPNELPPGVERLEINTLAQADKLAKEMTRELQDRFSYDFTPMMDELHRDANGNLPRDVIVKELNNAKSDYGREVMRDMLNTLDREESDRRNVHADVRFAWRES